MVIDIYFLSMVLKWVDRYRGEQGDAPRLRSSHPREATVSGCEFARWFAGMSAPTVGADRRVALVAERRGCGWSTPPGDHYVCSLRFVLLTIGQQRNKHFVADPRATRRRRKKCCCSRILGRGRSIG